MKVKKVCLTCKKEFFIQPYRLKMKGRGQYCSRKCRYTGKWLICKCGKTFYRNLFTLRKNKNCYCSRKCTDMNKKGTNVSLETQFEKGYIPWNRGKKYTEDLLFRLKPPPHFTGEKSSNWKGGITPIGKMVRNSFKYKEWRSSVFQRDNYTCQGCKKTGIYLEAHHIKSFSEYIPLRFNINNGIIYCTKCHGIADKQRQKFICHVV